MNFKLYIGLTTKDGKHLYRDYVINQVAKLSDNFTIIEAIGYYKGTRENTLIFEFFDYSIENGIELLYQKIKQLAFDCNQECIGYMNCNLNLFHLLYAKNYIIIDSNDDEKFTEY